MRARQTGTHYVPIQRILKDKSVYGYSLAVASCDDSPGRKSILVRPDYKYNLK